MARVLALVPDLLFGSRLLGTLNAAGHEVDLVTDQGRLRERLSDGSAPRPAVLVLDLTDEDFEGAELLESLAGAPGLEGVRTLGFFSHVDTRARERAERAGFDLAVPRSRMAREGGELVARLAAPT
jgi:DNA-binding response OmpR family regulator